MELSGHRHDPCSNASGILSEVEGSPLALHGEKIMRFKFLIRGIAIAIVMLGLFATPTLAAPLAHDQPDGADWLMADWMLYSFLIFFVASLFVFLIALKRGMFHNIENAKYYILSIDEPDYYTPDWAKKEK